ncbi:MAG: FKBP-type peptidyl-prolyl cis-trans isomerase N-terminal domain-containing protein [Bacteroidetes bacterium]|nr:FKBP-type peptidyl-prolyl cis-trans isomerase N-terminal domain-containing protein [Bacteroidota bacterium]
MLALVVLFTTAAKSQTMEFKTKEDSMSYALGVSIAGNLKQSNLDKGLNVDLLAAGMKAFLTGGQCKIDAAASNKMISEHMQAEQAKQAAEKAAKAGENKAKGEAF